MKHICVDRLDQLSSHFYIYKIDTANLFQSFTLSQRQNLNTASSLPVPDQQQSGFREQFLHGLLLVSR